MRPLAAHSPNPISFSWGSEMAEIRIRFFPCVSLRVLVRDLLQREGNERKRHSMHASAQPPGREPAENLPAAASPRSTAHEVFMKRFAEALDPGWLADQAARLSAPVDTSAMALDAPAEAEAPDSAVLAAALAGATAAAAAAAPLSAAALSAATPDAAVLAAALAVAVAVALNAQGLRHLRPQRCMPSQRALPLRPHLQHYQTP